MAWDFSVMSDIEMLAVLSRQDVGTSMSLNPMAFTACYRDSFTPLPIYILDQGLLVRDNRKMYNTFFYVMNFVVYVN
jgi:hypothetical protein